MLVLRQKICPIPSPNGYADTYAQYLLILDMDLPLTLLHFIIYMTKELLYDQSTFI